MPPDVRYDGWNKKAQYDKHIISRNIGNKYNVQPQLPTLNQNLLQEEVNSHEYHEAALRDAQLKAASAKSNEQEFAKQLQETRNALEKEIHRQLVEQLTLRAQKKSVTPDQQALIEKLYLDLRLINPELALATLKASAALDGSAQIPMQFHTKPQQPSQEHAELHRQRQLQLQQQEHLEQQQLRHQQHLEQQQQLLDSINHYNSHNKNNISALQRHVNINIYDTNKITKR